MYLESTSLTVAVQFWVQSQNMDFEWFNFFLLSYIIISDSLCMLISIITLLLKKPFSSEHSVFRRSHKMNVQVGTRY